MPMRMPACILNHACQLNASRGSQCQDSWDNNAQMRKAIDPGVALHLTTIFTTVVTTINYWSIRSAYAWYLADQSPRIGFFIYCVHFGHCVKLTVTSWSMAAPAARLTFSGIQRFKGQSTAKGQKVWRRQLSETLSCSSSACRSRGQKATQNISRTTQVRQRLILIWLLILLAPRPLLDLLV